MKETVSPLSQADQEKLNKLRGELKKYTSPLEQASEVVEKYTQEMLERAILNVEVLRGRQVSQEDVVARLREANSAILWATRGDRELYNEYRYRVFSFNGKLTIVQGKEISLNK